MKAMMIRARNKMVPTTIPAIAPPELGESICTWPGPAGEVGRTAGDNRIDLVVIIPCECVRMREGEKWKLSEKWAERVKP
jgi:hypothetical protein